MHRVSLAGLTPSIVKPETHAFLESILSGRGQALGIERPDGELVAYGFLQHALLPEDDPRPHLGIAPSSPIAKLAGAAVTPGMRGSGLQRTLIRARVAIANPGDILFCTASPLNPASWISLLDEGFSIRRLEYRYGGHARFLHVRLPGASGTPSQGEWQDLAGDDIAGHAARLAQGWVGMEALSEPPRVRYRRGVSTT